MARARNIKPSIMDNEELAELPFEARLLFIYMWMLADREGRLEDRPKRIAAQALPYDRSVDINESLSLLQASGFIERYTVDGVACIQINGFTKHQTPHHKEVASELPPPNGRAAVTRHPYNVPAEQRARIFARDGHACLRCQCKDSLTIDHIVPLSKGGDNSDGNLQTLCHRCNSGKGDATKSYVPGTSIDGAPRSNYRGNSTLGQRSTNDGASCRTDSGFSDSLIPDTGLPDAASSDAGDCAKATKPEYPEGFEQAWREYPQRPGASRADSLKAWKARVREGVNPQTLIDGVLRYAAYCRTCQTDPSYIKQPATFFGPGRHYEADWTPPARASPRNGAPEHRNAAAARAIFGAPSPEYIDV